MIPKERLGGQFYTPPPPLPTENTLLVVGGCIKKGYQIPAAGEFKIYTPRLALKKCRLHRERGGRIQFLPGMVPETQHDMPVWNPPVVDALLRCVVGGVAAGLLGREGSEALALSCVLLGEGRHLPGCPDPPAELPPPYEEGKITLGEYTLRRRFALPNVRNLEGRSESIFSNFPFSFCRI